MESIKKFWSETMEIPEARWIVILTGLVICVAIAYYVAKMFRDMATGNANSPSDYISEFQKLRDEGKLDDEEYTSVTQSIPKTIPKSLQDDRVDELPDFKEQPEPSD